MNFERNPICALKHLKIFECFNAAGFLRFGSFVEVKNLLTSGF